LIGIDAQLDSVFGERMAGRCAPDGAPVRQVLFDPPVRVYASAIELLINHELIGATVEMHAEIAGRSPDCSATVSFTEIGPAEMSPVEISPAAP